MQEYSGNHIVTQGHVDYSELKIILTESCNAACSFCLQGKNSAFKPPFMAQEKVLQWIDWAVENNINTIRFTGGEPTLHQDLKLFCAYAKLNHRQIILNTHGSARLPLYRKLFPYLSKISVSMPHMDGTESDRITGIRGGFEKKLKTIREALAAAVPVLLPTALSTGLKGKLIEFVRFCQENPGTYWGPLRHMPSPDNLQPWSGADAQDFAKEISQLMRTYPLVVSGLRNATPFCAVKPLTLGARVFSQRMYDCNLATNITVDVDGNLKTCYISPELEIKNKMAQAQAAPKQYGCCSVTDLPDECQQCEYLLQCGGGCHSPLALVKYQGKNIDYLAGFVAGK